MHWNTYLVFFNVSICSTCRGNKVSSNYRARFNIEKELNLFVPLTVCVCTTLRTKGRIAKGWDEAKQGLWLTTRAQPKQLVVWVRGHAVCEPAEYVSVSGKGRPRQHRASPAPSRVLRRRDISSREIKRNPCKQSRTAAPH